MPFIVKMTKYIMQLGLCEIYHPHFHGQNEDIALLYTSFIYMQPISIEEFYHLDYQDTLCQWERSMDQSMRGYHENELKHPHIRNYLTLVKNNIYRKPQIVSKFELDSGHTLCIIKTLWLKILQRKWKKYYQARISSFKQPQNLMKRSILGHW